MSNLNSFAELIRKGKEDKRLKDIQEQERKLSANAPLLTDLFKQVSESKRIVEKQRAVVAKVDELEANQVTQEDLDDLVSEKLELASSETEKKLIAVVKKLQDDIANLKRHVDSKPSHTIVGASAGSGEVRILRMDDIVKGSVPAAGDTLVWSTVLNKFELKPAGIPGDITVTDEEVPYAKRIDFITDNLLYKGEAVAGASESASVWRIHKVTIGTDGDLTEIWADGSSEFNKAWSNRLSYTYL